MKSLLSTIFWVLSTIVYSQSKDSLQKFLKPVNQLPTGYPPIQNAQNKPFSPYKPEIFTSGFIDIINSGQVNASARFLRLFVGEPGKFSVPLSLYSGVSSNSFQNPTILQRSNDALVTNFINPLSGLVNISIDGVMLFNHKSPKVTKAGFLYHIGERVLTGIRTGLISDPATGKPINFLNSFGSLGLYFQTGAWERNKSNNVGVFWFAFRYIGCYTNPNQIKEIIPTIKTNGMYHGYSIAWGVEINNYVNIKVIFYKYIKKPEIDYYLPIYQFSFNYTLKK
ncbi:MAG TPA: hypothetical protein VLJ68_02035 [Chitinophagaceae bacterium]|nr:hypothetical protein [Chitinophagaceae bacterium]